MRLFSWCCNGAYVTPGICQNRQNLTKQRVNCNVCKFFFNWRDRDISQKNADSNAESRDSNCIPNTWDNLTEGIGAGGTCWLNFWREEAVRWRAKETARTAFYGWQNRFLRETGIVTRLYTRGGSLLAQSSLTSVAPWTVARQAPLSMAFPRQEYWSGSPFPPPGDLPQVSCIAGGFFTDWATREDLLYMHRGFEQFNELMTMQEPGFSLRKWEFINQQGWEARMTHVTD